VGFVAYYGARGESYRGNPDRLGDFVTAMEEITPDMPAEWHDRLPQMYDEVIDIALSEGFVGDECRTFEFYLGRLLHSLWGDEMQITGWLAGEKVRINGETFELTGDACESCGVNPMAYGRGGGVRCIDTGGCGWWSCE